ncbi:MAG TPA: hypothetical protein VF796_20475, partial [Humisphaera sp.]
MRYRIPCPACGKPVQIASGDAGQTVACGACGRSLLVPPGLGAPGELTPVADSAVVSAEGRWATPYPVPTGGLAGGGDPDETMKVPGRPAAGPGGDPSRRRGRRWA